MFLSDGSEKNPKWTVETVISGKVREELHFLCIVRHKFVVMGQFRNKCVVVSYEIPHRLHRGDSVRPILCSLRFEYKILCSILN